MPLAVPDPTREPVSPRPKLYPNCGCPAETYEVRNLVCRNADCIDYGTHRRGLVTPSVDRCQWCGTTYTRLAADVLRGAK